jgi:hypothetical protein
MQPTPLSIPPIGAVWPGQGGRYAGLCRGRDGQPDHHLIVADAAPASRLTWKAALAWAPTVEADGHADFALPDRHQSAVLYANVDELFVREWHWTSTEGSERDAWIQYFGDGDQFHDGKSYEARARAVRRLPINPSILWVEAA